MDAVIMMKTQKMIRKDFCVFILTHGRADKISTDRTLVKCGYTGPIYYIIDDEDKMADQYREKYGDAVLMFSKEALEKTFDTCDNFDDRRTPVYARNACFDFAEQLGYKYFIELDDDYNRFYYKFDNDLIYRGRYIHSLDDVLNTIIEYFISTKMLSIAFSQGGDFIGGNAGTGAESITLKRKAMNSFICATDRRFEFTGKMNDDVNTYVGLGNKGDLFFTTNHIDLKQRKTQQSSGGITELYLKYGTYVKSFYTVMLQPSSVIISSLAESCNIRLHHKIKCNLTFPKILS